MKVAVICYHKNLGSYPEKWIRDYKNSILQQTYRKFDIYEVNYGGGEERVFEKSNFESIEFPTFVHAMNHLLNKLLIEGDYDCVFNTNVDDYYSPHRIAKQLGYIGKGYDIVSSNFILLRDKQPMYYHKFHELDIKKEFAKRHNIIGHPVVVYSRKFWQDNQYDPSQIPAEDFRLWERTIDKYKFHIVKDHLLYHRIHGQSVCNSQNR